MSKALLDPILEGIRTTNFFNGRLLSGEDLAREQSANRDAHRRIGRAIGEGVAYGLEVSKAGENSLAAPVVSVSAGVAINRKGDVLELLTDTSVSLVGGGSQTQVVSSGFTECEPPAGAGFRAGDGVYLLVMWPAEGREGRAPVSGLGNITPACSARSIVEGVRFRLAQIGPTDEDKKDTGHLRNRIAYRCFGTESILLRDPFGSLVTQYGAIDDLRKNGTLTACDVPLAVISWTAAAGIEFIDMWAARRRLTRRAVSGRWGLLAGDRRASEVEAMFLQFEDQIGDMLANEKDLGSIQAKERFAFLPPAGLLPVNPSPEASAFKPAKFFGVELPLQMIDGVQLRSVFHDALFHEPIDPSLREPVRPYVISENVKALRSAIESKQSRPFLTVAFARLSVRPPERPQDLPEDLGRLVPGLLK